MQCKTTIQKQLCGYLHDGQNLISHTMYVNDFCPLERCKWNSYKHTLHRIDPTENALHAADWIGLRISLAAHEGVVNLDEGSRPRVT